MDYGVNYPVRGFEYKTALSELNNSRSCALKWVLISEVHSGAFLALFQREGADGGSALLELKFSCLISQRTLDCV